jgi:hypothetical protein
MEAVRTRSAAFPSTNGAFVMSATHTAQRRLEDRARRAAKRVGLRARKSRSHPSLDNEGYFMLVDPDRNWVVAGSRFELSAEDVLEYCEHQTED